MTAGRYGENKYQGLSGVNLVSHFEGVDGAQMILNPGFEVNLAGWSLGGTLDSFTRITTDFHSGVACARMYEGNTTGSNEYILSSAMAVSPGVSYKYDAWVRILKGPALPTQIPGGLYLIWYTGAMAFISQRIVNIPNVSGWQRVSVGEISPATAGFCAVLVVCTPVIGIENEILVDDVFVRVYTPIFGDSKNNVQPSSLAYPNVVWREGKFGYSFQLDPGGSEGGAAVNKVWYPREVLNFSKGTVSMWVNWSGTNDGNHKILFDAGGINTAENNGFMFSLPGSEQLYFRISTSVTLASIGTIVLLANRWYHVIFTYDFDVDQFYLYLDGVQEASRVGTAFSTPTYPTEIAVGNRLSDAAYRPSACAIDDLVILDHVATQAERSALYGSDDFHPDMLKYGIEAKTGLTWALEVDWDDDNIYSGDNEADLANDLMVRRGRKHYIMPNGTGFEPIPPGEMEVSILNTDGRYDPYNVASPLYPYVMPGKRFRLRVKNDVTGTIYPVMTGRLDDIVPFTSRSLEMVRLTGVDNTRELENIKAYIETVRNKEAEVAVQDILDYIEWPDGSDLENSSETIPYWWAGGNTAIAELRELADSVLGVVFVGNDGVFHFYTRYHNPAVAYTLDDGDAMLGSVKLGQPWEVVRNVVKIQVFLRTIYPVAVLWSLQDPLPINPGESVEFWIDYSYNNRGAVGSSVIDPVAVIDYLMNTNPDGSGTDLTASHTVILSSFGTVAKIIIANNSASISFAYFLQVRGDGLVPDNLLTVQNIDQPSIDKYKRREFNLARDWIQQIPLASDYAVRLATFLAVPQFYPFVRMRDNVVKQLSVDLFDKVTVDLAFKSILGDYFVAYIEHKWVSPTGDLLDTTMYFEPVPPIGAFWTLDVSELDVSTILGF